MKISSVSCNTNFNKISIGHRKNRPMKSQVHFGALPISKIHINTPMANQVYKLYELSKEDSGVLDNLSECINLEFLLPNLKVPDYTLYNSIIKDALRIGASGSDKSLLLAAEGKRPCGILNYSDNKSKYFVSTVATWPIEQNKKLPYPCKAMMSELFDRLIDSDAHSIELYALRDSVGDPVTKYFQMGFKTYGGDNITETMRIAKEDAIKSLEKFKSIMKREPLTNQNNVDLSKELII